MAIDLADLVPAIRAEMSPPGSDLFPDADDDAFVLRLSNAFWEAKLFGFAQLANYTESDGLVQPVTGTTDLPREEQQLVVLFAASSAIRMQMMNTSTMFRAKAGSVEFETQNSATVLREVLLGIQEKIDILYAMLAQIGRVTDSYFDSLEARNLGMIEGVTRWWGSGHSRHRRLF